MSSWNEMSLQQKLVVYWHHVKYNDWVQFIVLWGAVLIPSFYIALTYGKSLADTWVIAAGSILAMFGVLEFLTWIWCKLTGNLI